MNVRLEDHIIGECGKHNGERALWWRGAWWSRKVFADLVSEYGKTLKASGFGEGQRLAVLMPNCPAFLALMVAAWNAGGTIVPLNLQSGKAAIAGAIQHSEASAVFLPQGLEEQAQMISAAGVPAMTIPLDGAIPSFTALQREKTDPSIAVLFYTSGTTGTPKGVPVSHDNLYDNVTGSLRHFTDLAPGDVFVNALPNFHALGFTTSGLLPLLGGHPQVILPTFMPPETTLEAMRAGEVTVMIAVPTMIALMLGAVARGATPPSSLRILVSGGDRFPRALDARAQKMLGVGVLEGYGLTETSPVVSVNPNFAGRKLGTVGTILDGYQIEVRGEDGAVLPAGEEGTLWLRGPSVFKGYFRAQELTDNKFADGWFNTGDVAKIDDDGYMTIIDRVTDIAIVGGFNVYPTEVESVLQQITGVRESAVVGVPHPVSGEIVKAYIVPTPDAGLTAREVTSFCREHLAHYKVPRLVEFVEDLPRSSIGKVLKRELRRR